MYHNVLINSVLIFLDNNFLIIHPKSKDIPTAISIEKNIIIFFMVLKCSGTRTPFVGKSGMVENTEKFIIAPKIFHNIPKLMIMTNKILAQFLRFNNPIADTNVVDDINRKVRKNKRTLENKKPNTLGIFLLNFGSLVILFSVSVGNITLIITFCIIETNIAKPAKTIKIHDRTVMNDDF